ncbi:MAG: hypothetical protein ACR2PL_04945 [Dehalococcoidia bacterium]
MSVYGTRFIGERIRRLKQQSMFSRSPVGADYHPQVPAPPPSYSDGCPFLGLSHRHDTRTTWATMSHRCFAYPDTVSPIAFPYQEHYCLIPDYRKCPRFQSSG